LIPDSTEETENERLKAMEATQDGFQLAELDLRQRGPGEFMGTRQSGFADLQLAQITDVALIEKAREQAKRLFEQDPDLSMPQHRALAERMRRFWRGASGELS
jgi:ATP-dependent DNA helicase RecG